MLEQQEEEHVSSMGQKAFRTHLLKVMGYLSVVARTCNTTEEVKGQELEVSLGYMRSSFNIK